MFIKHASSCDCNTCPGVNTTEESFMDGDMCVSSAGGWQCSCPCHPEAQANPEWVGYNNVAMEQCSIEHQARMDWIAANPLPFEDDLVLEGGGMILDDVIMDIPAEEFEPVVEVPVVETPPVEPEPIIEIPPLINIPEGE
jgi:hypothetical protein